MKLAHIVAAVCAALSFNVAHADNWVVISHTQSYTRQTHDILLDTHSVVPVGNNVYSASVLEQYTYPQHTSDGDYVAAGVKTYNDCSNGTRWITSLAQMDANGNLIYVTPDDGHESKHIKVTPGSVGYALWRAVCVK